MHIFSSPIKKPQNKTKTQSHLFPLTWKSMGNKYLNTFKSMSLKYVKVNILFHPQAKTF